MSLTFSREVKARALTLRVVAFMQHLKPWD